ncbi:MAG: hypothetical protein D8M57_12080 [Candidatus Scalindua sp. AMX11]|nr:MAG: hypothetical protein DWQ00_01990 [Candidatus Scalindua sp.]NOG85452.1 hypothetical protein [Planctomycetota bacterium]RZV90296.1 MAG: hypothetical protein EX341_06595 [Candidatus Scalindua sp. SCAELEC01]TDE64707.1 MAG: hypothetical protein D8M57_12080 [Candidatus Scalindua sp. AMX11]
MFDKHDALSQYMGRSVVIMGMYIEREKMFGLNELAAIIVFPILCVVILVRIVCYFLERGTSQGGKSQTGNRNKPSQTILVKSVKEGKSVEKRKVGHNDTQERVLKRRTINHQTGESDKAEQKKRLEGSPGDQASAPVSNQELKQSMVQPQKVVGEREKAAGIKWEEIEKKWPQVKNNDSCKRVKKILGPPTSIKNLTENRVLWVYVYGLKEKRTITFKSGFLEKIQFGENAFAQALIDLQARKS